VIVRRLLVEGPGAHTCAVSIAGSIILDEGIELTPNPSTPLEYFLHDAITEVAQRTQTCRQKRSPLPLADRNIILVDCGIRTGSTMKAAIQALRTSRPKRIVGAVPVASREGYAMIADLCDDLICLAQPEKFVNAGYWYRDFSRPGDEDVGDFLLNAGK
jgi:predicted phosphoribosyltransferase